MCSPFGLVLSQGARPVACLAYLVEPAALGAPVRPEPGVRSQRSPIPLAPPRSMACVDLLTALDIAPSVAVLGVPAICPKMTSLLEIAMRLLTHEMAVSRLFRCLV